ncbi:ATP synthase subunit B [Desulfuromonas carbonis]|uniref:F0F1 ATP synthase subunit B family protein n=1 Tax=Desulfuromonas sp. DDH964 TaxID=1823759 RepID=UPI00078DEA6B|nr:F0F1 ATP synthase subunit B [Desulfuromonas sp. DDH964]AMV73778.1 ATP synthase subunit b [Desulfuromonas sp. DDH964]
MLIDWFTVGAQVLNFLLLVWLLKRFLYQPILHALDAREKRIAAELANADRQQAEARREREEYQQKIEEFAQQRTALLNQEIAAAKVEGRRLLDAARQAADDLSAKRLEALRSELHSVQQDLQRRVQREVFAIARKALGELAATSLEERLAGVLLARLRELDDEARSAFSTALGNASSAMLIRSAFDLPTAQRAALQTALNETFAAAIEVRFETAPELISGIELSVNGQKVAWSIAEYLTFLEKEVEKLIDVPKLTAALAKPAAEKAIGTGGQSDGS